MMRDYQSKRNHRYKQMNRAKAWTKARTRQGCIWLLKTKRSEKWCDACYGSRKSSWKLLSDSKRKQKPNGSSHRPLSTHDKRRRLEISRQEIRQTATDIAMQLEELKLEVPFDEVATASKPADDAEMRVDGEKKSASLEEEDRKTDEKQRRPPLLPEERKMDDKQQTIASLEWIVSGNEARTFGPDNFGDRMTPEEMADRIRKQAKTNVQISSSL